MDVALTIVVSYLIGAIPNAYLITKAFDGRDLRTEGSRNIGTRNAFEVTSNKGIGIAVLLLDMLKGAVCVAVLVLLHREDLVPFAMAAAVIGHCYPVYLRFHGGRGLATAAAIGLGVSPILVLAWLLFYVLASFIRKNVHLQSMLATIGIVVLEFVLRGQGIVGALSAFSFSDPQLSAIHYALLIMMLTIASRHVQPVAEYLKTT